MNELMLKESNLDTKSHVGEKGSVVEEVFQHLKGIFVRHFNSAMLEAGQYLINKFYNGDYLLAQDKKFTKNESLNKLFLKIQADTSGNVPRKTWLYNSINLAIDHNKYGEVSAYGKLGHSHKVKLTNTGILPEKVKIKLMEESAEKRYSVNLLQQRITEEKNKLKGDHISLSEKIQIKQLQALNTKKLESLKHQVENRFSKIQDEMNLYKTNLTIINEAIEMTLKDNKKKVTGFNEWITKSINICTGCPNDCKYCFSKDSAYRFKQINEGQWSNEKIRSKDVNKNYKLYEGRVGFPTSHDITLTNINDYLTVLNKLLAVGNEVLIVSKPRFDCIKRICDETTQYKKKIIFRFSIGAMDDKILSFWDTNAPLFEERKKSLKYAFDNGFQTSVSMEPLLDSSNVVETVTDLIEYVTDFVWIGKMNYIGKLKNKAKKKNDQDMLDHVEIIEKGQTDEEILAIHAKLKKRPELMKKIKWKDSYKKALGLESATEVGMDI